jgi:glucose/mannose-6-phosphate isomerase
MLDELDRMKELDPKGMLDTVGAFPDQLKHATAIAQGVEYPMVHPKNVVVAGMGGSGISGALLQDWAFDRLDVPIQVVNDYHLPAYCGDRTLVFVESYSGNTEETLSCFEDAMMRGCTTVAIASGGELARRAKRKGVTLVEIPDDLPVPRAATAYLLVPLLVGMEGIGLAYATDELREAQTVLQGIQGRIGPLSPTADNEAKQLAHSLLGTIPVVYGQGILRSVARRWRTQLNENPKMLARDDVFPECNHNDTPAWGESGNQDMFSVVLLRDNMEPVDVRDRVELTREFAFAHARVVCQVNAQGESALARIMSAMYMGDYTSLYLAFLREMDPAPVEMIEDLKGALKDRRVAREADEDET